MHFRDWSWKYEILILILILIHLTTEIIHPHRSVHTRAENVCAGPISHSIMHFRDWSRKDEILIKYKSDLKEYFRIIGVCMCMQEPKTRVKKPKAYVQGLLLINGHISEIGDEKTKSLLNILLDTTK
jgi:hypothetical protein